MCYYGNGAFSPTVVYGLPIHLRNFYYRKLIEVKTKENDAAKKSNSHSTHSNKIDKPSFR
jgi:hypothetical protein